MTEQKEQVEKTPLYQDDKLIGYCTRVSLSEINDGMDVEYRYTIQDFEAVKDEPAQQPFKVGEYYVSANNQIYKLTDDSVKGVLRRELLIDDLLVPAYVSDEELQQDRLATIDEIAFFKRAEHFHSKGRKLNEFRHGDIVNNLGAVGYVTYMSKNRQVMHICFSHTDIQVEYTPETFDQLTLIMTAEELEAAATNM